MDDNKVRMATTEVLAANLCMSDDPHVIALAKMSGTRLLFTNDILLEGDFKKNIPRGIIFTTKQDVRKQITREHRSLLNPRRRICNC